ncbi:MAG: hypothetical protein ABI707_04155 [Ferruginibacter sp.]
MKKILLFLSIAFAGCGAKTNEDIAKDLIAERLKTTLPDFNNYEALNYGTMGKAFLPYEETDQYIKNTKAVQMFKDSISILQQLITAKKTASADGTDVKYKERMQQLLDSAKLKNDTINSGKRVYIPEQLFKLTHAYKVKDKSGVEKTTEEAYYFDKDFKKIQKVQKIY